MICPNCDHEYEYPSKVEYPDTPEAEAPQPRAAVRVGFSTPKSFNPVSWLVRKFTGSRASHAFFVYHDADWDMDVVLEAHELGIRLLPLAHFERTNRVVKLVTPKYPIDAGLAMVEKAAPHVAVDGQTVDLGLVGEPVDDGPPALQIGRAHV